MRASTWLAGGLLISAVLFGGAGPAAGQAVDEIDWNRTSPASGRVVNGAVEVATDEGGSFPLVTIDRPAVGAPGYAITGRVRYQDVDGQGFLEMWSEFPDGSRYFSRTLDGDGPMAALSGTSGWREFRLPFFLDGPAVPSRLEVGVVLPGAGRVWVGPLGLEGSTGASTGWWSDRTAGLVGGIGGAVIGILGGVSGWLVSRRRARGFVVGLAVALTTLGFGLLIAGGIAVLVSQPYAVWFELLLTGAILVIVFGSLIRTARRAYADAELRRMRAMDVAHSSR